MVLLTDYDSKEILCAGTLVSEEWVLTAAHCSLAWQQRSVRIVGGIGLQDLKDLEHVHIRVADGLFTHPQYYLIYNDLMLIKLNEPITEDQSVEYVTLPEESRADDLSEICGTPELIGWGMGVEKYSGQKLVLSCAQLKFLPPDACREVYKKYNDSFVGETVFCTNTTENDACYGDSGAPLMCGGVQYGLVTWGIGCEDHLPGFFTRVDKYLEFMDMVFDGIVEPRTPGGTAVIRENGVLLLNCLILVLITFVCRI
nr:unnamed protein product [Callosobruchus analis]